MKTASHDICRVCGGKIIERCRCPSWAKHDETSLRKGHGILCENGHRYSGDLCIEDKDAAERHRMFAKQASIVYKIRENQQYDTDHFPKRISPTWKEPTLGDQYVSEVSTMTRSVLPMERGKHLMMSRKIAKCLLAIAKSLLEETEKRAVSVLPNDVLQNGYPQELMSPSPNSLGSIRPGDDPILTGRNRR